MAAGLLHKEHAISALDAEYESGLELVYDNDRLSLLPHFRRNRLGGVADEILQDRIARLDLGYEICAVRLSLGYASACTGQGNEQNWKKFLHEEE